MKVYVIVKGADEYNDDIELITKPEYSSFSLPNEKAANDVMKAKGFDRYVAKHGYHFTEELSKVASDMMINANGMPHKWTPEQIERLLKLHGLNNRGNCTIGDLTYLANMAYADFYPLVIKDEASCLKYAVSIANDPDGYDGVAFSRWVSDLIGKGVRNIEWERFI